MAGKSKRIKPSAFRNAEAKFRRDQAQISRVDRAATRSEFSHDRFAGAGLLGRALDEMYCVYNPGQKVRFQPPKLKDGAGKPLFGRYRGAR